MIIKSHTADTAVLGEIIDGDLVQRLREKLFFKAASNASFVILAIAHPPLFLCISFTRYSFAKVVVRQSCKHVDFLTLIILYDNRLKMGKLTFYKKLLLFVKFHGIILLAFRGVAQLG